MDPENRCASLAMKCFAEDESKEDIPMKSDVATPRNGELPLYGSCDGRGRIANVETSDDGLIVQILARLDLSSYEQALFQDAKSVNENFLLPIHFPWNTRQRLPQKMHKTMPRDIDDLHAISHCEDELYAPFGDFSGPFGYGRYENGQARGHYSQVDGTIKSKSDFDVIAAARRSDDPGVIELSVRMPLSPPAAAKPSHGLFFSTKKWDSELVTNSSLIHNGVEKNNKQGESCESELKRTVESQLKADQRKELALSCIRRWRVSVKVGGVSSRSSILPSSIETETNFCQQTSKKRKVIRPFKTLAAMPQTIQVGETVTVERAAEMDNEGFALSLGSYDCRFTEKLLTPKKEAINRVKRVEIGRTRLLWTSLIQGDEPFLPSTRNRINYNSLITGQRVDGAKCRRPIEVNVAVRLHGKLIVEEALEDPPVAVKIVRKRKHSTRQAENEVLSPRPSVECHSPHTAKEIEEAFSFSLSKVPIEKKKNKESYPVVYVNVNSQSSLIPDTDRHEVVTSLLKFNQKKSAQKKIKRTVSSDSRPDSFNKMISNEFEPMKLGASKVLQHISPTFACLPLEDGLLRTVCLTTGRMAGSLIHELICDLAREESGDRCSVCWGNEGKGKEGVLECCNCGLKVHSNCCMHKGDFISDSNLTSKAPSFKLDSGQEQLSNGHTSTGAGIQPDEQSWRCAVCSHFAKRTVCSDLAKDYQPKCALCIHSGGAMSPLKIGKGPTSSDFSWAHEVCRVWSGLSQKPGIKPALQLDRPKMSPLSSICALCGFGNASQDIKCNSGLTRCAARGCFVAFHPMCAFLVSKLREKKNMKPGVPARTRTTRSRLEQNVREKKTETDELHYEKDKNLCKEYTLKLLQLRADGSDKNSQNEEINSYVPIAFCGLHNPHRELAFYGCLPCGKLMH